MLLKQCTHVEQFSKMKNREVNTLSVNTYLRHVAVNPLGIGQDVIPQNQASSQGLKKVIKNIIQKHEYYFQCTKCIQKYRQSSYLLVAPSLFLSLCIKNNKTAFILEDKNSARRQKNHKINPCKFCFFSWQTEIKAHYVLIADAEA